MADTILGRNAGPYETAAAPVRYVVQDDAKQATAAARLIENECTRESPGFVSHLVLPELLWVLGRGYGYDRQILVSVLLRILVSAELRVQKADLVWSALRIFEQGTADFADYLIAQIHASEGCEATWTFDRKAAKSRLHQFIQS